MRNNFLKSKNFKPTKEKKISHYTPQSFLIFPVVSGT